MKKRCTWVKSEVSKIYHDTEWGREVFLDEKLFEYLILETMQAGLSWEIILKKRENLKKVFCNFDYVKCSKLSDEYLDSLLTNENIIRHKLKIYSVRKNAKSFLNVILEFKNFKNYLAQFSDYKTTNHHNKNEIITKNELSDIISRDMKKRGFSFVGSVTIYSYLQAIGIIDAHEKDCFCYAECRKTL